ncbi:MAG: hypothetical protein MKZ67_11995, partial [Acidimicrobiales bacterium]|nr:hypothetical protein [Acidimicrobiales bacterium]
KYYCTILRTGTTYPYGIASHFGSSPWATRRLHSDGPGQRYLNGPPRAFRLLVLACTLAFKITRVLVTLQVSD